MDGAQYMSMREMAHVFTTKISVYLHVKSAKSGIYSISGGQSGSFLRIGDDHDLQDLRFSGAPRRPPPRNATQSTSGARSSRLPACSNGSSRHLGPGPTWRAGPSAGQPPPPSRLRRPVLAFRSTQ